MIDIGTGVAITFSTGFLAQITSVDFSGISRESVDTSHMGTVGAHTHMPVDLIENGSLDIEIHFDPDTTPPINAVAETVVVTFPLGAGQTSAATWSFSAFMTNYKPGIPMEDIMVASCTLKISGDITIVAAVAS